MKMNIGRRRGKNELTKKFTGAYIGYMLVYQNQNGAGKYTRWRTVWRYNVKSIAKELCLSQSQEDILRDLVRDHGVNIMPLFSNRYGVVVAKRYAGS